MEFNDKELEYILCKLPLEDKKTLYMYKKGLNIDSKKMNKLKKKILMIIK